MRLKHASLAEVSAIPVSEAMNRGSFHMNRGKASELIDLNGSFGVVNLYKWGDGGQSGIGSSVSGRISEDVYGFAYGENGRWISAG